MQLDFHCYDQSQFCICEHTLAVQVKESRKFGFGIQGKNTFHVLLTARFVLTAINYLPSFLVFQSENSIVKVNNGYTVTHFFILLIKLSQWSSELLSYSLRNKLHKRSFSIIYKIISKFIVPFALACKSRRCSIYDILNVTANHKQTLENYSDCYCTGNVGYIKNVQQHR